MNAYVWCWLRGGHDWRYRYTEDWDSGVSIWLRCKRCDRDRQDQWWKL